MNEEYTIEKEEYRGYTVKLVQDTDAMNPRTEWDNLGTMICFHNRYNLGDETELKSRDFSGWQELHDYLIKECDAEIILPLFFYDHSGITISCSRAYPFNDRWDAGQAGFIYISKEKIRKEYSVKHITKKLIERVTTYLEGEVETYDDYLTGNVCGFVVEDDDGEHIDSCWGFYGTEGQKEAMSEAKGIVDGLADERDQYNESQAVAMC